MEFLLRVYEERNDNGVFMNGHSIHKCNIESMAGIVPTLSVVQAMDIRLLVLVGVVVVTPSGCDDTQLDMDTRVSKNNNLRRGNRIYCNGVVYDVEAYIPVAPTILLERKKNAIHVLGTLQDDVKEIAETVPAATLYSVMYAKTVDATMLTLDTNPNDNDVIQFMKHELYTGGSL